MPCWASGEGPSLCLVSTLTARKIVIEADDEEGVALLGLPAIMSF